MNKDLEKFVNKISSNYHYLNVDQIKNLIEFDTVFEDIPISTGKKLIIKFLKFNGIKNNGDTIDFHNEFEEGVNIILADNLRGKSTILKLIKAALVGDIDCIKADVKDWIKNIVVGFQISNKEYTIEISLENRLSGVLYSVSWRRFLDKDFQDDNIIFKAKNNKKYIEEIQKFFFNQFSYYSLKWTQKTSAKDYNQLVEASASWKTYYKAIYLESKDSASFYGGQDQKVFQMLLGLENTYWINHLSIKRDMLQFQIGKEKDYENRYTEKDFATKNEDRSRLEQVQMEIVQIKNRNEMQELVYSQKIYNEILESINKINKKIVELNNSYNEFVVRQKDIQRGIEEYGYEERRVRKEIIKNTKLLYDLKEYIEVGRFFSNLDIKRCPSCNHEVQHTNDLSFENCPLCHEEVNKDEDNKHNYILKIDELEILLIKLEEEKKLLENKNNKLKHEYELETLNDKVISENIEQSIIEKNRLEGQLNIIVTKIDHVSESYSSIYEKEKTLIAEQAVLLYKTNNSDQENADNVNLEKLNEQLRILNEVIKFLDSERYEKSKNILDTLTKIMLSEIHEFGLESITDIKIDNKFNIIYIQNGIPMKFDDIAEGEQLRAKLAFYLSIIQMDIEKNFGRHTRLLIIDSPNKEEGDSQYLEGLKDVLLNINKRYKESLQIIIGTATRELENVVENQTIYPKGKYVF